MKKRIIIASVIIILLGILTIINIPKHDNNKEIQECLDNNNYSFKINNGDIKCNKTTTTTIKVETTNTTTTTKKVVKTTKKVVKTTMKEGTYKLTHYGWDCKGCGGNTASGYNVRNTIYYNDATYGKLRIVAMKDLKLYSVIRIKNYDTEIYAIVLDRGVGSSVIDLLVENEKTASKLGIRKNIEIEVLRSGK